MEVSVVIPVYRSEENLTELVRQLSMALQNCSHEVILVNDASPDGSWTRIVELASRYEAIVGINLRMNSGQDNAIMAGLRAATAEYVVVMDDDLQHSPSDILSLRDACRAARADVCYARFAEKKQALWKNVGSWLNGRVADRMIGKPPALYLSPFKAIRQEIVKELIRYDGPFPYVDGLLFSVTKNVTQIPVEHHSRFRGTGNYSLVRSLRVAMRLATGFSVFPLRLVAFLGFVIAALGFGLGVYYVVQYFTAATIVQGWTTIVVLFLFVSGIILLSLGMIGEYLGRAYITINRRPQYTIGEIVRGKEALP